MTEFTVGSASHHLMLLSTIPSPKKLFLWTTDSTVVDEREQMVEYIITRRCGDATRFATEEPTVRFFHFHLPDGTACCSMFSVNVSFENAIDAILLVFLRKISTFGL